LIFAIEPRYSTPSRFLKKKSANEELNSSKEELQSLNEKLETANSELQGKVQCNRLADSKFPPIFFLPTFNFSRLFAMAMMRLQISWF